LTADAPEAADRLVTLGTLGKSLASAGGFITCSQCLRELMINRARSFIFDTALPPPTVAAALAALDAIQSHPSWPAQLQSKAERLRTRLQVGGLNLLGSRSQIVPVLVGDNETVIALAARLRERDLIVAAVRPPSVAPGTARLRLTVSLAHTDTELDAAADAILDAMRAVA
jgi:8-amino-7-oxononanoate synthase